MGVRSRRLDVRWTDACSPDLDRALDALPEMESCPHDLYRLLARTPSRAPKRFALVSDAGVPVAAVALRRRHRHWELMCDGVVPFAAAPALPGRLWDALDALGVYVRIVEWEGPALPASARLVETSPRFAISTRTDFDAYWLARGNRDWLKKTRRRTRALGDVALEVDGAEAARWTIDRWRDKWAADPAGETSAAEDIRAATDYFVARGACRAFRLLVDGRPVAGVNTLVHTDTLVMMQSFRDPAFDRAGVGVHLDELIYRWSATSPYDAIDLGCGAGYKSRWADAAGTRATFIIAPLHLAALGIASRRLRALRRGSSPKHDITYQEPDEPPAPPSQQKLDNAV